MTNRDVRTLVPVKQRWSEESQSRLRLPPAALATCANGTNEIKLGRFTAVCHGARSH